MRSKRFVSLMMALIMAFTLFAPTLVWAAEGDGGEEGPADLAAVQSEETEGTSFEESQQIASEPEPAPAADPEPEAIEEPAADPEPEPEPEPEAAEEPATDLEPEAAEEPEPEPMLKVSSMREGAKSGDGESGCSHSQMYHCPAWSATCGSDGNIEFWYCPDCMKCFSDAAGVNEIFSEDTIIPATGNHTPTYHEAVAATCTAAGSIGYWECSGCGRKFSDEQCTAGLGEEDLVIPALGHGLVPHEAQAATCTEIGWGAYDTCSRCDYTTYEEIPALGHDLVHHEAQVATCTEYGWEVRHLLAVRLYDL